MPKKVGAENEKLMKKRKKLNHLVWFTQHIFSCYSAVKKLKVSSVGNSKLYIISNTLFIYTKKHINLKWGVLRLNKLEIGH